jgi:hypothetical protein
VKLFSRQPKYYTMPKIHKSRAFYFPNAIESTPIIWKEELCVVLYDRPSSGPCVGTSWKLYRLLTKELLFEFPWKYALGSAIVANNRLYIFGSTEWNKQNHIGMMSIDENYQPSPIQKVWDASSDMKLFNTSVCADPEGYIMAYETDEKNVVNFSVRFAKSTDLEHWTSIGAIFHPDIYCACPAIRYYSGYYYIIYLRSIGKNYIEFIARTQDFLTFEEFQGNTQYKNNVQVLSSIGSPHEGINNSDIDLVEYNGMTIIMYGDGDQKTWGNLRTAVYLGSMGQFFEEFFPSE